MNVLICTDTLSGYTGISVHMNLIKNELLKSKHKVTMVSFCSSKKEEKYHGKKNKVLFKNLNKYYKLKKDKFDLVILGWYAFLNGITDTFPKVVYILPSIRASSLKITKDKMIKEKVLLEKTGMEKLNKIIYPSNFIKNEAKKHYGIKKGKIIHHGIMLNKFKKTNKNKIDVLTVANFDKRKGVDKLLKVAQFLKKRDFVVIGDGPERKEYEHFITLKKLKNISLPGRKNSLKYYSKAKIYVLPSRYEAFGLVLLEAMASKLPCVAFKPDGKKIITASNEIIKDGKTGFLVKDEKEMAEKIDLLLSNDKLREKMGKAAEKEAEKYSIKKEVNKILKYLK